MVTLSVRHKVANYPQWRKAFDEDSTRRRQFGEASYRVFRSAADPLDLTIQSEWSSMEQVNAFIAAPELKAAMQQAGVVSQPDVVLLEAL